jgi:hypothetical protein
MSKDRGPLSSEMEGETEREVFPWLVRKEGHMAIAVAA